MATTQREPNVYRNVYIKEGVQPSFTGDTLIYYTGKVVYNIKESVLMFEFDRNQDLYLTCSCNMKHIKAILKKN